MSRGRPRRTNAKRYKSGDIVKADQQRQEDPRTAQGWNRYRDHHVELCWDERLASVAGRLFWTKRLTAIQFEAVLRYAIMLDDYDVFILGKRRVTKPPAYERSSPGESAERDPEQIASFLKSFHAAHRELLVVGKLAEAAATRLCRNEGVAPIFDDTLRGVNALAAHFGLTGKEKRVAS